MMWRPPKVCSNVISHLHSQIYLLQVLIKIYQQNFLKVAVWNHSFEFLTFSEGREKDIGKKRVNHYSSYRNQFAA